MLYVVAVYGVINDNNNIIDIRGWWRLGLSTNLPVTQI